MRLLARFKRGEDVAASPARRTFLRRLGGGAAIIGLGGFTYQWVRSLVPNVLYEPPKRFKIGNPASLAEGMTFLEDRRLYVFKEGRSMYAISAVCTHLGCTVKYVRLNQPETVVLEGVTTAVPFEFHCPCHGSRFYADGTNYAGPAPRPLHWYRLELAPEDGQLTVDLGNEVDRNFRLTV